jgi:2-(1,2-epoxy-1,2-dihydrophenyl)acetyl-CoA isomerase
MTDDGLRVWTRGPVRWLAPDRPAKLNAWTLDMAARLTEEFSAADADDDVAVIVLAGTGGVFSAGIDRSVLAGPARPTPFDVEGFVRSRTPTIACVDGLAFGMGATSALACDLRVVSDRARFVFGFVRVGITPEWGSTYLLSRQVGLSRAMDLCLTGREVSGEQAYRLGLADRLVPANAVEDAAQELAELIAQHDPATVQATKAVLWQNLETPAFADSRAIELAANVARLDARRPT